MESIRLRMSKSLKVNEQSVIDLCNSEEVINFLLVWSRFETLVFEKNCSYNDVIGLNNNKFNQKIFKRLKSEINDFFLRYKKDKTKLQNLVGKDKEIPDKIQGYIDKSTNRVTDLQFLTYIVFRYRNNIFHGNKGVLSWLTFREQIKMCTNIMMTMIEEYK